MNIREMFTELCTESERENQKRPVRPRAAFIVMGLLSLVVGAALFLIATLAQDGVSFSRIDYSGHGFCGWAALFCSCVFIGGIISILALWFLRLTPRQRPKWRYFVFAIIALALLFSCIARHCQGPIFAEMGLAALACAALFSSFYDRPSSKLENKKDV